MVETVSGTVDISPPRVTLLFNNAVIYAINADVVTCIGSNTDPTESLLTAISLIAADALVISATVSPTYKEPIEVVNILAANIGIKVCIMERSSK